MVREGEPGVLMSETNKRAEGKRGRKEERKRRGAEKNKKWKEEKIRKCTKFDQSSSFVLITSIASSTLSVIS